MTRAGGRVHKHLRLSGDKIRAVQRALGAATETEAVERALDYVLEEEATNRHAIRAHRKFLASGGEIQDVYGVLEQASRAAVKR